MSIWNWVTEKAESVFSSEDAEAQEMLRHYFDSSEPRYAEIERRLSDLDASARIARRRRDSWWELFCHHWKLQVLIHEARDMNQALDLAVKTAVEARNPSCAGCPQRVCVHEDLITVYQEIDPFAYQKPIRDALAYMESETAEDAECRHCLRELWTTFERDLGNLDAAQEWNQKAGALAATEENAHHLAPCYTRLCQFASMAQKWDDETLAWAQAAGRLAYEAENWPVLAEAAVWEAACLRRKGHAEEAQRAFERAEQVRSRLEAVPRDEHFDALSAYYQACDALPAVLEVRQAQWEALAGSGRRFAAALCQVRLCRLKQELGTLAAQDVQEARRWIEKTEGASLLRDALPQ